MCDAFVFLDTVQYTKQDWRNRNRIRTLYGPSVWLTVPVAGGSHRRRIRDVALSDREDWRRCHMNLLRESYGAAPYYAEVLYQLEFEYQKNWTHLAPFTIALTKRIAEYLKITTPFCVASDINTCGDREQRLIELVQRLGGTTYLSGPAAKSYIRPEIWLEAGIEVAWKSYEGYPQYQQIGNPFDPAVSIVDLLFMKGPDARDFLSSCNTNQTGG